MNRQGSIKGRAPGSRGHRRWWRRLWLVGVAAYLGGLAGRHPWLAQTGAAVTVAGLFLMLWPRRPADRRPPADP